MSIAILIQVYDEARRLAIAGGAVAAGDFRLKKLLPPLEQAGAKAPVFAKVAQAAQAVVESNERTASAALLDLAALVNAILYTQGETGAVGELKPIETTDLGARETQTSARTLKPLLDALKSTGSGRLELVREAIERGTFKDLRLVKPALKGLDDPFAELADLIAEKVLPIYGKAILPELRATLDIKGRAGHLHRLRLMHKLDPAGTRETVLRALDEGSKEIRVAAIECLGTDDSDLAFLLEQTKSKAKDVRVAALRALISIKEPSPEVIATVKRAIDGADLDRLIDPLQQSRVPEIQGYVLARAEQQYANVPAEKDVKKQGAAVQRLQELVRCLEKREDKEAEAFMLRCFDSMSAFAKVKSVPSGEDFNELLVIIHLYGTPKMQQKLAASHASLSGEMLPPAYDAAMKVLTPAKFFENFRPILDGLKVKRGKKGSEYERAVALKKVLESVGSTYTYTTWGHSVEHEPGATKTKRELDPRWLDAALDVGDVELVCDLARSGHARVNKFLSDNLAESKKPIEGYDALQAMVRIGHPEALDAVVGMLTTQIKGSHADYVTYWMAEVIPRLPKSALPKIEAVLPSLPDKAVDRLMDAVHELRNKPE